MTILMQISDPHFGTEQASVVEALVALARMQQPELVVISGDITQRARPAQFIAARAFADRLGTRVLAVPGNHDIPLFDIYTRLLRPYARYSAAFGANLEPVYRSPDLLVIGVNTTRVWRHKAGEISLEQVERVADILQGATPLQLRAVVVHQPIAVIRDDDLDSLLHGHQAAVSRWAEAGADLIMGGHIHRPYVALLKNLVRPMWVVQAGTAISTRTHPGVPNSVNLLRWGQDSPNGSCHIDQWDYDCHANAFRHIQRNEVSPFRSVLSDSSTRPSRATSAMSWS